MRVLLGITLAFGMGCSDPEESLPAEGEFALLSYNVAGLPQGLSGSDPKVNIPQISPRLNDYDIALVQEDFSYQDELRADAAHEHISDQNVPPEGMVMGDGLNRFSNFSFDDHARTRWEACFGQFDNGSDCLAAKGFSMAPHKLSNTITVDIYNLHMDASGDDDSQQARADQVEQLIATINSVSADRAVIVAGDTNLKPTRTQDVTVLARLKEATGIIDACEALSCPEPERIDRVFFRPSADVNLEALSWELVTTFVDSAGEELSDHEPVAVRFFYSDPQHSESKPFVSR
jgi:hypothetical protein